MGSATYAAIVMYVINLNKPEEYRNRLHSEIFESLQEKIADIDQEEQRDSFYQNHDQYETPRSPQNLPNRPSKNSSNYHDSNTDSIVIKSGNDWLWYYQFSDRAFEPDFDETASPVKPKAKSRQKKPQPFRDVEL